MITRRARWLLQGCGGIVAGIAVAVTLLGWRLAEGPLSLPLLTPVAERLVSARIAPYQLHIADTMLSWEGWKETLDLRFHDLRLTDEDGLTIARAPALSASLSPRALARGRVAPESIRLFNPRFSVRRDADGVAIVVPSDDGERRIALADADPTDTRSDTGGHERFLQYLKEVRIVGAAVRVEDLPLGIQVTTSAAEIRLWRDGPAIRASADLALNGKDSRDQDAEVAVKARYSPATERLDIGVAFSDLRPAAFPGDALGPAGLDGIDLPLSGTITVDLPVIGGPATAGFAITGGGGRIRIPDGSAADNSGDSAQRLLNVAGLTLHGHVDSEQEQVTIHRLTIDFGDQGHVRLPLPLDHDLPLRRLSARGQFDLGRLHVVIDDLQADLGGPRLAGVAVLDQDAGTARIRVAATMHDLGVDDLHRYWPPTVEAGSRAWVTRHLAAGVITRATVTADIREAPDGGYRIADLAGTAEVDGTRVSYLPPMPPVEGASARAVFDTESFLITLDSGHWNDLRITGGTVRFDAISERLPRAEIVIDVEGPLSDHLKLIDHPPLGYAAALGISPQSAAGTAAVRLAIGFPLLAALRLDDIDIRADAEAESVSMPTLLLGQDLADGRLTLAVDKEGLEFQGRAYLGGIAGSFEGRETFDTDAPTLRSLRITIPSAEVGRVQEVIFGRPLLPPDMAAGAVAADIVVALSPDGRGEVTAALDLTPVTLDVPALALAKPPGQAGSADVTVRFQRERVTEVAAAAQLAGGTQRAVGTIRFADDHAVESVELPTLVIGRTDARARAHARADGGWVLDIQGKSFDLLPLRQTLDRVATGTSDIGDTRQLRLTTDIATVWLSEDRQLRDLTGSLTRIGPRVTAADFAAATPSGTGLAVLLQPGAHGHRRLMVTADDAGDALRTLGLFSDMIGGSLSLDATFADDRPSRALEGRLLVSDYRLSGAPFIARLLSVMALTGIEAALRGDGIRFSVLDVPFTYSGDVLQVTNARASGSSLGFTASGRIDLDGDDIDLRGTVVPLYAVNATLGRIPLIGDLLTGGERGGGVFAATYRATGRLDDPQITVNPLAALAPGFVRNIFGALGSGAAEEAWSPPGSSDFPR
ncbi:MAG: hypothetical protein EA406_09405 [Rhodospirillales bacterium]|nr:MAG: hypothetical protein EA406_09405 [Rhodospirillales bacterium]